MASRFASLLLALVLLVTAACGGEAGGGSEESPNAQPSGDTSALGPLSAAECDDYASSFSGLSLDSENPTNFSNFEQVANAMQDVSEKVPDEVAEDFRIVARAFRGVAEGARDLNFSDPNSLASANPEDLQQMQAALEAMNDEEVRNAVANVERFLQENCPQG